VFITNQITNGLGSAFKWLQVTTDTSKICVVGNFDVVSQTANVTFQNSGTWYDYIDGSTITATGGAQSITLQPGEYHVYLNRNVVSNIATPVFSIRAPGNALSIKSNPNPISKNSVVNVTVPESGKIEINLLTVSGQKLVTVYSGFMAEGDHTINFENNGRLPAGLYVLQASTKTSRSTIKIILE